jgi:trimeric autotransporter adhesin
MLPIPLAGIFESMRRGVIVHSYLLMFLLCGVAFSVHGQIIFSLTATSKGLTNYTNGQPNDSIFYYCTGQLGQLRANPPGGTPGWNFAWQRFVPASNSWQAYSNQNNVPNSVVSNVPAGGYRVTITDGTGTVVGTDIAWVLQITANPTVNVAPIAPGCGAVNLQGTIANGSVTPYYNPPTGGGPPPAIVGSNTEMQICYTGTHTFVSDLAFVLIGPPGCGNPQVYLMQSSEYSQGQAVCNGGDNFTNLCFSTQSNTNINVCGAPVPLSGSYGSYGAGQVAINWNALNGCNAAEPGWSFQVWDCVGGDIGNLTSVTVNFTGQDASGNSMAVSYASTGLNAAIGNTTSSVSCPIENAGPPPAAFAPSSPPAIPINCSTGYLWSADPPFAIPNATSSLNINLNPGPTVTTAFTLQLTGSCSVVGCGNGVTSDTEIFTYTPPSTAVITPVPIQCIDGSDITLQCSISGGTWTGPGITDAVAGIFSPAAAGLGTHIVSYVPGPGCSVGGSIQITVLPTVDPTIADPGVLCETQDAFALSVATAGGFWSGNGIVDPVMGLFDPTVAGAGTHTITYFIPNACNNIGTLSLQVDPSPVLLLSAPNPICTGATASLTANFAGGQWTGTGIVDPLTGLFDPAVSGIGDITLTYALDNACQVSQPLVVTVLPTVDPTIDDPGLLCEQDAELSLSAATAGGIWSGNGIVLSVSGLFDPGTAGPGTHTITYTIANACNNTSSLDIVIADWLIPVLSGPSSICLGEAPVPLTASVAGGNWSGDGITDGSTGTFNPALAGEGVASISYDYDNGCQTSTDLQVNVINFIDATITPPAPVCEDGNSFVLSAANPGGVWQGTGVINAAIGQFDPTVSGPGTFIVSYEINGTCYGYAEFPVVISAIPEPTITDPGSICAGGALVDLNVTVAGGQWSGPGITNASTGIFNPAGLGAGSYTITYSIVGVCNASTTRALNLLPAPFVNAGPDQQICEGESATFTAVPGGWDAIVWSGGSSGTSLTVQNQGTYGVTVTQDGCSSTDQVYLEVIELPSVNLGGFIELCQGESEVLSVSAPGQWSTGQVGTSITVNQTGTYSYLFSEAGCTAGDSVDVEVFTLPVFDLGSDRSSCPDEPVILAIPYEGLWSTGFFGTSITANRTAEYSVTVNNGPCRVTDQLQVTILPTPIAALNDEYFFCKGGSRTISAFNPVNDFYMWSNGSQEANTLVAEPGELVLTTGNVCGMSTSSTLVFEEDCTFSIYIPNSFTPNNDGFNDVWKPVVFNLQRYELSIFNRWGEVIFKTTDPDLPWTGAVKDGDYYSPDGIYFYQLIYETDRQEAGDERGYIFVLR